MTCPKNFPIVPFVIFLFLAINQVFAQQKSYDEWKKGREKEITAENGWINLAGLFPLSSGTQYLNEVSDKQLKLEKSGQKGTLGSFEVGKDSVWFSSSPNHKIYQGGQRIEKTLVFPLEKGKDGNLQTGRWKWAVIKRGEIFMLRLRDLEHPGLAEFKGQETFPYQENWKVSAFFQPKFNQTISITNVLGQQIEWNVMGILKFEVNGMPQELIALEEEGKLFLIFSDETNGEETYPSGRYLYASFPDKTGMTTIDFNYAYNPPCAFTEFATCPIPPKENRLEFGIEAGEKYTH